MITLRAALLSARALLCTALVTFSSPIAHAQTPSPLPVKTIYPDGLVGGVGQGVSVLGGRAVVATSQTNDNLLGYIYNQSGGNWLQGQALIAPGFVTPGTSLHSGWVVAQNSNTIMVSTTSRVFVFEQASGASQFKPVAILTGNSTLRTFGLTLAMDNCTALVGSEGTSVRPQERGWVHVYSRCLGGGGKWTWQGSITAPETAQTDQFSRGLAIAGNEMLVGAPGLDLNRGAVYYYVLVNGKWTLKQKLVQNIRVQGVTFGASVSFYGGFLAVGVPGDGEWGKLELYKRNSSGTWTHLSTVDPGPPGDGTHWDYGQHVEVTATHVVVARKPLDDTGQVGWVWIYKRVGDGLQLQTEIAGDPNSGYGGHGQFGYDISVAGRTLIVGEPMRRSAPEVTGAAHIYQLPP